MSMLISSRYPFSADQEVPVADWEIYLRETANAIVSQQSPQRWERPNKFVIVGSDGLLKAESQSVPLPGCLRFEPGCTSY